LRSTPVPRHRRDARRHCGDRHHRACAGEARVSAARAGNRHPLGHDDVMSTERIRTILRGTISILIVAALYEMTARSGLFPRALMPTLGKVGSTLVDLLADGTMLRHAFYTLYRMLAGFALAVAIGLPLGILMGRYRSVESFFLPLTSALMPIPS